MTTEPEEMLNEIERQEYEAFILDARQRLAVKDTKEQIDFLLGALGGMVC